MVEIKEVTEEELRQFWQARVPGERGQVIAEVLFPYYQPRLSFKPRPPLVDLKAMLPLFFPWRQGAEIRLMEAERLRQGIPATLQEILRGSSLTSLGDELREQFSARFDKPVGTMPTEEENLWGEVLEIVSSRLGFFYINRLRYDLAETLGGDENCEAQLRPDSDDCLGYLLYDGLDKTLTYGVGSIALDNNRSLVPLIGIWSKGNLPLGFDTEGRALFIVASPVGG